MNKAQKYLGNSITVDFILATIAWEVSYFLRLYFIFGVNGFLHYQAIGDIHWVELLVIPTMWCILYYFSGTYNNLFQKNYFDEFKTLLLNSLLGCSIIFLTVFLDDIRVSNLVDHSYYYLALSSYFTIHFLLTFIGRYRIIKSLHAKLQKKEIVFPVLVLSDKENPFDFYQNKKNREINYDGYPIIGAITNLKEAPSNAYMGNMNDILTIINENNIEIVIINLKNKDREFLAQCFNLLAPLKVELKMLPDIIDIIAGNVKTNNVLELDLIDIHLGLMPPWEQRLKRLIDIMFASIALILLFPLLIFLIIRVKFSSPGPIFYKQERIGFKNTKFTIYKFRSMQHNAENPNQPLLATDNDPRITKWGKVMRKWRLDELPQFWNVLIGNMSIVGPRPEREYFIRQLENEGIPFINLILRVKPGISSLGMVRYGYASNIEQMKERIKYDLIYIENISVIFDFKIVIETISIVFKGRGK